MLIPIHISDINVIGAYCLVKLSGMACQFCSVSLNSSFKQILLAGTQNCGFIFSKNYIQTDENSSRLVKECLFVFSFF